MSTNPARQSPAGPPQKLKYPVNRYSPPRGDFIDQDEMAAKLKEQNATIRYNAKENPCCGHCWQPRDDNHAHNLDCQEPCGACGRSDHQGCYCNRLYMTHRTWTRYYHIKMAPDYVQVKPTPGEEELLIAEGVLQRSNGQLHWALPSPAIQQAVPPAPEIVPAPPAPSNQSWRNNANNANNANNGNNNMAISGPVGMNSFGSNWPMGNNSPMGYNLPMGHPMVNVPMAPMFSTGNFMPMGNMTNMATMGSGMPMGMLLGMGNNVPMAQNSFMGNNYNAYGSPFNQGQGSVYDSSRNSNGPQNRYNGPSRTARHASRTTTQRFSPYSRPSPSQPPRTPASATQATDEELSIINDVIIDNVLLTVKLARQDNPTLENAVEAITSLYNDPARAAAAAASVSAPRALNNDQSQLRAPAGQSTLTMRSLEPGQPESIQSQSAPASAHRDLRARCSTIFAPSENGDGDMERLPNDSVHVLEDR